MKNFILNVSCVLIVSLFAQIGYSSAFRMNIGKNNLMQKSVSDTTPASGEKIIIDGEEFLKPTKEAIFHGNNKKWERYFQGRMKTHLSSIAGTCEIGFVIDENGNTIEVRALKMSNPAVAKAAIDIIKDSPKWDPAELNGMKIKSYRVQNFSLSVEEVKEVKTEVKREARTTPTRKGTHF